MLGTQEEAAEAYDIAAIKFRGVNAVTNFDISRYHVDKIMESNTLPTGESARRHKEILPVPQECPQAANTGNVSDWKMVLQDQNQYHQENTSLKMFNGGDYQNPSFSAALHDLISINPIPRVVEESNTPMGSQYSTPSSLVTSFNSSREASPDRNEATVQYKAEDKFISPPTNVHSWFPTALPLPKPVPLTTAHLPVFAAWSDA